MSQIKIETLTPIHIGSGNLLMYNNDYVDFETKDRKRFLGIINPEKVLNTIGEKGINSWIETISNKTGLRGILGYNLCQYTDRHIRYHSNIDLRNEKLREAMHSAFGEPYIPGSSIKGAIRSAILATEVQKNDHNKRQAERDIAFGRVSAQRTERRHFGSDANSDVLRFLRVGDAYFQSNSTIAIRMINLNVRGGINLIDNSKPQLIEAIADESEATFTLQIDNRGFQLAKPTLGNRVFQLGDYDVRKLFNLINLHTLSLIEKEIEIWEEQYNNKTGADDYIANLEDILSTCKQCEEERNSCVLRIGHGSGWRFITGAWAEVFDSFSNRVVPVARPRNDRYQVYDFPKTRRIEEKRQIPIGFVKLTIQKE